MRIQSQIGFTLVELAVVVFLVGLLASAGLSALSAQMANASISLTKKKQETIKDALISYLGKYKRLPCPAIDERGVESRVAANTPANCTGYFGILPYATLGLPRSAALDGWENFFSYAVSTQWTLSYSSVAPTLGGTSTNSASQSFSVGISGVLAVNDRSPATSTSSTPISLNAAVFVVSHGKNGFGAFTSKGTQNVAASGTDEFANIPVKTTWAVPAAFYQREYSEVASNSGGAFDDVSQWLSADDLTAPLLKDGTFKSEAALAAQWADQQVNIKNAVIGQMFSPSNTNTCAPPASLPAGLPTTDPWGGLITYTPIICQLKQDGRIKLNPSCGNTSTATATTFAYTISTPKGGTINGSTINQLIGGYPSALQNCPN